MITRAWQGMTVGLSCLGLMVQGCCVTGVSSSFKGSWMVLDKASYSRGVVVIGDRREIVVLFLLGDNNAMVQEFVVLGCWVVLWEQGFPEGS